MKVTFDYLDEFQRGAKALRKKYPSFEDEENIGMVCEPMGPFLDEEAIARIDKFEERLAKGEVKWVTSEEVTRHLYEKFPWLK